MIHCQHGEFSETECKACPAFSESVFQGLVGKLSEDLERDKTIQKVRRRAQLVTAGQPAEALLCIRKGWFKLTHCDSRGRDSVVRIVGPGETLGYVEVVMGGTFRLNARAVTDAEVCRIGRKAFESALEESGSVARKLLTKACQSMIEAEKLALSRASMSVRERIALTLFELARRFGSDAAGGVSIQLPLSRADIAGLAGTVLESAVRQLSELKDEGVIELKGRSILVRNMGTLAHIAGIAA